MKMVIRHSCCENSKRKKECQNIYVPSKYKAHNVIAKRQQPEI